MRLEPLILNILTKNEEYTKKVQPHLLPEYFHKRTEKTVYQLIDAFYAKYSRLPPRDVLQIELDSIEGLSGDEFTECRKIITEAYEDEYRYDFEWLVNETEKFCKDKSVYNAVMQAVKIINGDDNKFTENQIPSILQNALAVSFDKNVGHDYFDNAKERFDFYHKSEAKIKTSIDLINKITNNGTPRRTLNLLIGPSGSGKSAVKCSLAADYLKQGYNVLYLTMEMAEQRIAERIDANMFDIPLSEIKNLSEKVFVDKITKIHEKTQGKLVIKEYPTGTASVANFRVLMDELKNKRNFVPDIVFVDYLGICASARYKTSANVNSYTYQTSVSEELRAFAVEYDIIVWSSVQTNRSGMNVSDFDVEAMADSTGPLKTADLLLAIIRTDDLTALNQIILKQLKNRFGDPNYYKKFVVGMDFSRMKMYNVENSGQTTEIQSTIKNEERESRYGTKTATNRSSSGSGWDFDD
jgi:archaellum biogenesis ATPase FlaH